MSTESPAVPLFPWSELDAAPLEPLSGGLINLTFAVGDPPIAVVQRLHPVFAPVVHQDIEAVTAHVAAAGLLTPRILRTTAGDLCHVDDAGHCWRALTWIAGRTLHRLDSPTMAASAARFVGRWHQATADLDHTFRFTRPGAHDSPGHMARLRAALQQHPKHRLRGEVARVAEGILSAWAAWGGPLDRPERLAHGDLKVSNLLFDAQGEAICLVDLDTVAMLSLDVELGDAWRSWCNPAGEDVTASALRMDLFEAAATAYLEANPQDAESREALETAIDRIALELAARFAADALHETYFGWDPAVAPTRGDHNLLRARGQLALALSVADHRHEIRAILRRSG